MKIPLTRGQVAIIDDEDYELVSRYKWYASPNKDGKFYAMAYAKGGRMARPYLVSMHRLILGTKDGEISDHINGNGLDNRKANLRPCNKIQNMWNSKKRSTRNPSSRYKGVYFRKDLGEWVAQIGVGEKTIVIGRFRDEDEAAIAYNEEAIRRRGAFAKLNDVARRRAENYAR